MIPAIHERLNQWAEWCIRGRNIKGLGYPGQCIYTRLTPSSNSTHSPNFNDCAYATERAVHQLTKRQIRIVKQFYLHAGTADTHAKALRMGRTALYYHIEVIHRQIEANLNNK